MPDNINAKPISEFWKSLCTANMVRNRHDTTNKYNNHNGKRMGRSISLQLCRNTIPVNNKI